MKLSSAGQLVAGDRARQIGRHDDHQLGFVAHEVAAAEERAEDRQLRQAGKAVDVLADVVADETAIIIEPPEGSSTVVSARRLRSEMTFTPGVRTPLLSAIDPSVVGSENGRANLQADAAGRQHDRHEFEPDAVFETLVVVGHAAVLSGGLAGEQVELAADPEGGLLARHPR